MEVSRRNFLVAAGMLGAASKAWSQAAPGAPARQQLADYHWGDPYEYLPQAKAADHKAPSTPEAINGPWKKLRAVQQKRVIDIASHSGEHRKEGSNYRERREEADRGDELVDFTESLVESMDKHGIAKACLTPVSPTGRMQFPETVRSRERYPGRFEVWGGLRNLRPRPVGVEAARILREQLTKFGAKGVGEGAFPRSEKLEDVKPFMEVVMEFNVPILNDSGGWGPNDGAGNSYRASWRSFEAWGNLVAQWPDVTWIMCDTGGPYLDDAWQALRVAFTFENVYVEVSKTQAPIITEAVRGVGAERVIYGSDWVRPEMRAFGAYHFRGAFQHWWGLNQVAMADITEDQRDMILYKNAMRLLKMNG